MDCQSHSSDMMVLLLLVVLLTFQKKKVLPCTTVKTIIFFAARQKDHARSSVSELLLALKDPRSLSESRNNTLKRKSQESGDVLSGDEVAGKRSSESGSRRNSRSGMRNSLQKISEVPEGGNKTRKSGLRSFMGYDIINHMI